MKEFDPMWEACHKKVVRMYEDLAQGFVANNPNAPMVDMIQVIAQIVCAYQPHFDQETAIEWVKSQYSSYKAFDVYYPISEGFKKINPQIPENGIRELFQHMKNKFFNCQYEHQYFLYFVISKFIEIERGYGDRGQYMMQITRGNIPKTAGFFRRLHQVAVHTMIQEQAKKK